MFNLDMVVTILAKINTNLETSNKLLTQIEENLRVPNMIDWANKIKMVEEAQ